jgi:hypothetical protein
MSDAFPSLAAIASSGELTRVARAAEGLDGRAVRKLISAACARDKATALNPNLLTPQMLLDAARSASHEVRAARGDATNPIGVFKAGA